MGSRTGRDLRALDLDRSCGAGGADHALRSLGASGKLSGPEVTGQQGTVLDVLAGDAAVLDLLAGDLAGGVDDHRVGHEEEGRDHDRDGGDEFRAHGTSSA